MALPSGVHTVPLPGACPAFVPRSRAGPTPVSQTPGDGTAYFVKRETSTDRAVMNLSPRCRQAPPSRQISAPQGSPVSRQLSAPRAIGVAGGPSRELSPRPGLERNVPSFSSSAPPGPPRDLSPQPTILAAPPFPSSAVYATSTPGHPRELSPQQQRNDRQAPVMPCLSGAPSFPSSAVCATTPGHPRELSPQPQRNDRQAPVMPCLSGAPSFPSSAVCATTPGHPRELSPLQKRNDRQAPVMPCLSGGAVLDERKRREISSSRFTVGTSADISLPTGGRKALSSRFAVEAGTPATTSLDPRLNRTMAVPVPQTSQVRRLPTGPQRSRSTERAGGPRMTPRTSALQSTAQSHRSQIVRTPQQNVAGTNSFTQASALSPTVASTGFPMQSMAPQFAIARNSDHLQPPKELLAANSASMTLPVGLSPTVTSPGVPMQSVARTAIARNMDHLRQQMELPSNSASMTLPAAPPVPTMYGVPAGGNQAGQRNFGIGPPRDLSHQTLAPDNDLKPDSPLCTPQGDALREDMSLFCHERSKGAQETGDGPGVTTLREELTQAQEMMSALRDELLQPFRALDDLVRAQELMQTKLDVLDEEVHQVLQVPPTDQMIKEEHAAESSYHPSPVPIESAMGSTCDTTPDFRHATHAENGSRGGDAVEYGIILDKADGAKLGINLKDDDTKEVLVVNDVKAGGLVDLWNTEHPGSQVSVGHFIVEVNGVEGSSELMLQECQSNKVLHITMRRPQASAALAHERVQLHSSDARTSFVVSESQPEVGQESELPSFEMMTQNLSEEVTSPADMEPGTSKQLRFDNDAVQGSESESNSSELWDSDARLSVSCKKTLAAVAGETILQIATSTLRKSCAARQFSMFNAALAGVANPAFSTQAIEEGDKNKLSEDKDCLDVVRQLFFDSLPEEFVKIDKIEQVFKPLLLRDFVKGVSKRGGHVEALFHGILSVDAEHIKNDGALPLQDSAKGVHVAMHAGVAHQSTEQDSHGRRRMCLVLADTTNPLKKTSDQEVELRRGVQTRHSYVEDGRLLASHLITYTVTGVVKKRTATGWHDPFEKKLSEALKKSVCN